jgi:sRNA-binding regulator protein Hfq
MTRQDATRSTVAVRAINQREFDALVPAQQEFYLELEKQGRVKITTAGDHSAPLKRGENNNGEKSSGKMRGPLDRLRDKSVKIVLVNGQTLTGTITEISRFEVVLDTGDSLVVVLKHAIISAEETKIPDRAAAPAAGGT